MKRDFELYIPTFVDVTELKEGELKERKVEISTKDIVSTKIVKKPLAPTITTNLSKGSLNRTAFI